MLLCLSFAASLNIDVNDGGYREVLVSIGRQVPYSESIVENIKALFRSSSAFLHRATNGRVYFKHVVIEAPNTWPKRDSARSRSSSSFQQSDVRVDLPSAPHGDGPFTQQLRPCGQPGDFIQLTPHFLAQINNATARKELNPAFVFVHEWAHFKYGVFDEYGSRDDRRYPLTYCHRGKVKLNSCSDRITFAARTAVGGRCGVDRRCRLSKDCLVSFHAPSGDPIESSIMFMPYVANVSRFCDNRDGIRHHNPFAPSKQNSLCKGKSTWEVIASSADFQMLPRCNVTKRIQVSFKEVQQKDDVTPRVVLVLDVSGSMNRNGSVKAQPAMSTTAAMPRGRSDARGRSGCKSDGKRMAARCPRPSRIDEHSRIEFLKEAATRYIEDIEDDSRRLAIVTFSYGAKMAHSLMPVNASTRKGFLAAIQNLCANGPTCIGCGVRRALELLRTDTESPEGADIILMSDGQENRCPHIATVLPRVAREKAIFTTLALGVQADYMLEELATATGGKAYAFQDLWGDLALGIEAAFVEASTAQDDHAPRTLMIMQDAQTFRTSTMRQFLLDADVGNGTWVYVTRTSIESVPLEAWLVDPDGKKCEACPQSVHGARITLSIPSPAKVGAWELHMRTSSSVEIKVSIQVNSGARRDAVEPIRVTCEVGTGIVSRPEEAVIYAKVTKGKKAVLNAAVIAEVYGPNQPHRSTLRLHDDGSAPDNHADDGTYSGYFTKFTGRGRYAVTAHITNQNGTGLAYPSGSSGSLIGTTVSYTSKSSALLYASEHPLDDFIMVDALSLDVTGSTAATTEEVAGFQRVALGGAFQVNDDIKEEQVPPGDVGDLAVNDVRTGDIGTVLVQLAWTWPGAHMTHGAAAYVEILTSRDYDSLKTGFENATDICNGYFVDGSLEALPSGSKHTVTVSLLNSIFTTANDSALDRNAYLAIRAGNSGGLKSNPSNIVVVSYEALPATTAFVTGYVVTTHAIVTVTKMTEATSLAPPILKLEDVYRSVIDADTLLQVLVRFSFWVFVGVVVLLGLTGVLGALLGFASCRNSACGNQRVS
ncbi:calcium-activated chloride channel regulator 3A-1-like [Amblyomma americanum]